jgi:dipeptidyl aminopeptidase/acylaminoacyl peptidase
VAPPRGVYTNLAIAQAASSPVIVANWASSINPAEIVRVDPASNDHRRLTEFSVRQAADLDWQSPEHFWFTSSRGRRIHSMIVRPPAFDPNRKYPLLVEIHGGAASMWRDQITLRWNYHLLARPGYVVLLTNYTGSTGFGEDFARAIQFDPLQGTRQRRQRGGRRGRFAASPSSMRRGRRRPAPATEVTSPTGSKPRRRATKCIVSHAGLVNSEAQWGTSDSIYHRELMAGGPPWEQGPVWRDQNPIRRAADFKTPILLSIGETTFACR